MIYIKMGKARDTSLLLSVLLNNLTIIKIHIHHTNTLVNKSYIDMMECLLNLHVDLNDKWVAIKILLAHGDNDLVMQKYDNISMPYLLDAVSKSKITMDLMRFEGKDASIIEVNGKSDDSDKEDIATIKLYLPLIKNSLDTIYEILKQPMFRNH